MNVHELKYGSIVTIDGNAARITGIASMSKINAITDKDENITANISCIYAVPVTEEFLTRNNFTRQAAFLAFSDILYYRHESNKINIGFHYNRSKRKAERCTFLHVTDKGTEITMQRDFYQKEICVHELQNAIAECRMNVTLVP